VSSYLITEGGDGLDTEAADDLTIETDAATTGWASLDVQIAWDDDPLTFAPTWTSVIADVELITTRRGRQNEHARVAAATLTVELDDTAGDYNPLNTSGSNYGKLTPYRQIRVVANDSASVAYTLFRGHVQPRGWQSNPLLPGTSRTTVSAAGVMQLFAKHPIGETDEEVGAAQTTSERIAEIAFTQVGLDVLTQAGWVQMLGSIYSNRVMQGTTFGHEALEHLYRLSLSEGGELYEDQNGVLTLTSRLDVFFNPDRTTAQATFDDAGSGLSFDRDRIELDYSEEIINRARFAHDGGDAQEVVDATSVADITGVATTRERLDLFLRDDPDAYSLAELTVEQFKDGHYGAVELGFTVESDVSLDAALHVDLLHRVTLKYTPPGVSQLTTDHFVEHITHEIPVRSGSDWKVTWRLSYASRLDAYDGDDFLLWDVGNWDEKVWCP
jgi:hypothetical protein